MNDASVALAARLVLASVLVVSAAAKLRTRAAVRAQMGAVVGGRAAALIAPALPGAEVTVAVALVAWWSPVPGVVALALVAAFTAVLVRAQVRRVPCACFGARPSDGPAGPASVVRNGVLAALAALAVGDPAGARGPATALSCLGLGALAAVAVRAAR